MLKHILDDYEIPIIEEKGKAGYWEIFKNADDTIIKKVWHEVKIKFRDVPTEEDIINQELNNMSLQDLYTDEKANKKSNFISLDDGESFEGEFVEVEKTTGQFGETNTYTFIIDGEQKILNSKSFGLLKGMASVAKEGDVVKLTKTGTGFKTKWQVKLVK